MVERRGVDRDRSERRPTEVDDHIAGTPEREGYPHVAAGGVGAREVEVQRVAHVADLGSPSGGELAGDAACHQASGVDSGLRQQREKSEGKEHGGTLLSEAGASNPNDASRRRTSRNLSFARL